TVQLGMIVKNEMKAILEEKYQDLKVSERTVHRELYNLSYVATLPRKVPLLTEQAKINCLEGRYLYLTENLDRHLYCKILNEQLYDNADELVGG
ncbi:11634_t:CDS:2, partial [Entrophospora sp. SA101]